MARPFILAITGPAGSGKTTVGAKLATEIDKCVNIDADHFKHLIVNGLIYGDESNTAGVAQWELLGKNVGMVAKNFQKAGYNVIINGYINEPAWESIQKYVTLDYKILLLPHVDVVTRRDSGRDAEIQMGAEAVKKHHDYFSNAAFYQDFVKVDSSNQGLDETVLAIKDILSKE